MRTVAWSVPRAAAARSACGASSSGVSLNSSNAIVTVFNLTPASAAQAAMTMESVPPDRNMPTGTSATR